MKEQASSIYLDNAATTPSAAEVIETMVQALREDFGNPSSVHSFGRAVKVKMEEARKQIARYFNVEAREIYFTSGGTEALSHGIRGCVSANGIERIISSPAEHSAIGNTLEFLSREKLVEVLMLSMDEQGRTDLAELGEMLKSDAKTMVCLMHANNVTGRLNPIDQIGAICRKHNALFVCDTVQSVGKYFIDFRKAGIHLAACSAHKFHGPKGNGFLFLDKSLKMDPQVFGGGQEKGLRSGTQDIVGVSGLTKALELCYSNLAQHREHIQGLKDLCMTLLQEKFDDLVFFTPRGDEGLYNMLYIGFPGIDKAGTLQFKLDMEGIAVSTGAACSSGASKPSHVLEAMGSDLVEKALRISFSRFTTEAEVRKFVDVLARLV